MEPVPLSAVPKPRDLIRARAGVAVFAAKPASSGAHTSSQVLGECDAHQCRYLSCAGDCDLFWGIAAGLSDFPANDPVGGNRRRLVVLCPAPIRNDALGARRRMATA